MGICTFILLTTATRRIEAVGGPYKVATADFTGDKKLDLAIAYHGIGLVSIEQGDGRGHFSHIGRIEVTVPEPSQMRGVYNLAVGDVDNDGLPDLAITAHGSPPDEWRSRAVPSDKLRAAWRGNVVVARNCGDGRFEKIVEYPTDSQGTGVRLADLNRDGQLDLLYTARGSGYEGDLKIGKLSIRQGLGHVRFGPEIQIEAGPSAYYVETADLNNDSTLDILVPNEHANRVTYFLVPARETFAGLRTVQARRVVVGKLRDSERTANVNDVRSADFNGDGNVDIVTANLGPSTVSVFLGGGDGSFHQNLILDGGKDCAFLAVGDLDSDGDLDFVVTHWTGEFLSVFLNRGDATFEPRRDYSTASGNYGVTLCDVDSDGRLDAVTANYRDRSFSLLNGVGDGTFRDAVTTHKAFTFQDGDWVAEE